VAYERLHERVCGLFRWWGAPEAETHADETLDRVARKLEEGAIVRDGSFGAYVRGVARLVFYESRRQWAQAVPLLDSAERAGAARAAAADGAEPALACLDRCLDGLDSDQRRLVLRYYDGGRKADARQALARELGISLTALRIRTHRLRQRLERCVSGCLEEG
jgi:DNA-directed RNA polymerase specialized sigma24 family protein